jgi:cell division protein FtsL
MALVKMVNEGFNDAIDGSGISSVADAKHSRSKSGMLVDNKRNEGMGLAMESIPSTSFQLSYRPAVDSPTGNKNNSNFFKTQSFSGKQLVDHVSSELLWLSEVGNSDDDIMAAYILSALQKLIAARQQEAGLKKDLMQLLTFREILQIQFLQTQKSIQQLQSQINNHSCDISPSIIIPSSPNNISESMSKFDSIANEVNEQSKRQSLKDLAQHSSAITNKGNNIIENVSDVGFASPPDSSFDLSPLSVNAADSKSRFSAGRQMTAQERAIDASKNRKILMKMCIEISKSGLVSTRKIGNQWNKCFVAAELVTWMTKVGIVDSYNDALTFCSLLTKVGIVDLMKTKS